MGTLQEKHGVIPSKPCLGWKYVSSQEGMFFNTDVWMPQNLVGTVPMHINFVGGFMARSTLRSHGICGKVWPLSISISVYIYIPYHPCMV